MTASKFRIILAFGFALAGSGSSAHSGSAPAELREFVKTLASGNQDRFETYFKKRFSSAALKEVPADERADRLARLYSDTHGFTIEQIVAADPRREVARVRSRLTEMPYCLTIERDDSLGSITDVTAANLPSEEGRHQPPPFPAEVRQRMARLTDRLAAADEYSGVILITNDERPVLRRSYGYANLAYAAPISFNTRFNVASIGKTITGVAIGQLLDGGRLKLDQKVGEILPDYPDAQIREQVTVRQLLTHTSGLGPSSEYVSHPQWGAKRSRLRTVASYLPLIEGKPLESVPGTKYSYSNSGYIILGLIVERLTGQSFYEYARSHIFDRAGMTESFYHELDVQDRNVATPLTNFVDLGADDYRYRLGRRRDGSLQLAVRGGPQGGLFTTADDLMRFITAVRRGRLTSLQTARLLTASQGFGRKPPETMTGLGFEIITHNGHTIIGHTGGDIGVSAFVFDFVDTGYRVVALSNYDARAIPIIWRRLLDLITRVPLNGQRSEETACR